MKVRNWLKLGLCARPERIVSFFVFSEIEKQSNQQNDAPHEPPDPILFPNGGNNESQPTSTHTKFGVICSECTSRNHRDEKAASSARFLIRWDGSGHPLICCDLAQFSTTRQSFGPMLSFPFFLSF